MQISVSGLVLMLAFPREDRGAPLGAVGGTGTDSQQLGEGSWVDGTTFQSKFPLLLIPALLCAVRQVAWRVLAGSVRFTRKPWS